MNALIVTILVATSCCAAFAGETNYQSPVDGKSYRADWHLYTPTNPPTTNAPASRVQKQGVRLLSTQEAFGRSVDVSELAGFIRKMEQMIDRSLGATNQAFVLVVKTSLSKSKKPDFGMASSKDVSQDILQKIYDGFDQLPDFRSRQDDVSYEVRFKITKEP